MENKWIQGTLENQTSNSSVVNVVHRHSPVLRTGTERQIVGSFQTNAASVRTLEMDRLSNYGMTFPLEHLVSEPQCIQNAFITWFDRIEKLSVPFTLCLDVIYNEHSFHEFEFLALVVQALESYYQGNPMKKSKSRNRVISCVNSTENYIQTSKSILL